MYLPRGNEGRLIGSRGYFIDCLRWKSVQYLNRQLIGLSKRGEQSVSRDVSLTGFWDRRVLARARGPSKSVFLFICMGVAVGQVLPIGLLPFNLHCQPYRWLMSPFRGYLLSRS